jgi:hypothetical protein
MWGWLQRLLGSNDQRSGNQVVEALDASSGRGRQASEIRGEHSPHTVDTEIRGGSGGATYRAGPKGNQPTRHFD